MTTTTSSTAMVRGNGNGATTHVPAVNGNSQARALMVNGHADNGTLALGRMSDEEFSARLDVLRTMRDRLGVIHKTLLDPEVDYGTIPGTGNKPVLLKPGAEKLCQFYGYAASFHPAVSYGDGKTAPPISVRTECRLHLGNTDGPVVGSGFGTSNSWERRYRYRKANRKCPKCGAAAIIPGKEEYGGGWLCFKKKDGCGAKFSANDASITSQPTGDTENPDPYELENTLIKISEKRALVGTTLRVTATSALYAQDLDEMPDYAPPPARASAPAREEPPPMDYDPISGEVYDVAIPAEDGAALRGSASLVNDERAAGRDGNPWDADVATIRAEADGKARAKLANVAWGKWKGNQAALDAVKAAVNQK